MKKVVICLLTIIMCLGLIACSTNNEEDNKEYALNEAFEFDDLEITISNNYEFTTLDNEFSEYDGHDIIRIPVTVKNLKNETHSLNFLYIKWFGSKGAQIETFPTYFDDSIEFGGDLRTNASYTKYFYILYDGDGTYTLELDDLFHKISININIQK